MSRSTGFATGVAVAAAVVVLGVYILGLGNADRWLADDYSRSLDEVETTWTTAVDANHVHLSRLTERLHIARKPLAVGDHITIAGGAGADHYAVVEVSTVDGTALGLNGLRLQVVTAQLKDDTQIEAVKMIFAVEPAAPTIKPDKEL